VKVVTGVPDVWSTAPGSPTPCGYTARSPSQLAKRTADGEDGGGGGGGGGGGAKGTGAGAVEVGARVGEAGGGTAAGFVVVAVAVCFCVGTGAVVVDDELDDLTVVLGVELRALEVAGATGGDEADPPHAASTTGSAMIQTTFSLSGLSISLP